MALRNGFPVDAAMDLALAGADAPLSPSAGGAAGRRASCNLLLEGTSCSIMPEGTSLKGSLVEIRAPRTKIVKNVRYMS